MSLLPFTQIKPTEKKSKSKGTESDFVLQRPKTVRILFFSVLVQDTFPSLALSSICYFKLEYTLLRCFVVFRTMNRLPPEMLKAMQASAEAETIAGDIMAKRNQMIEFDAKRQMNVEALSQFRQRKVGDKVWTSFGSFFIKLPHDQAKHMIETDQDNLSQGLDIFRNEIKADIKRLHEFRPSDLDSAVVRLALRSSPPVSRAT